eukprot:171870_1
MYNRRCFDVVLMLKHIVVIFDFHDIYVLDLKYKCLYKSHKSGVLLDCYWSNIFLTSCDDMIHVIFSKKAKSAHVRFPLHQIVPTAMNYYYTKNVNDILAVGYIKQFEKSTVLFQSIPIYLSKIIAAFYSYF